MLLRKGWKVLRNAFKRLRKLWQSLRMRLLNNALVKIKLFNLVNMWCVFMLCLLYELKKKKKSSLCHVWASLLWILSGWEALKGRYKPFLILQSQWLRFTLLILIWIFSLENFFPLDQKLSIISHQHSHSSKFSSTKDKWFLIFIKHYMLSDGNITFNTSITLYSMS